MLYTLLYGKWMDLVWDAISVGSALYLLHSLFGKLNEILRNQLALIRLTKQLQPKSDVENYLEEQKHEFEARIKSIVKS